MTDNHDQIKAAFATAARKRVGGRIKALRQARKWSREELGECLGVKWTTIEKYEQGQHEPQLWMLEILASQFGVTIDSLFKESDAERKPLPLARIKFDL